MAISRKTNPAIMELLETQKQFHNAMQRIVAVYSALKKQLSPDDQVLLEGFLDPYRKLSANPLASLSKNASQDEQVTKLDDVFRGQIRPLEKEYEKCSRQYINFLKFVTDKEIRSVKDPEGKDFDAGQQLIKATQNLMRYKILIDEARKPSNLGYQKGDGSYENDRSYQVLTSLSNMIEGDVKMINRRAQATDDLKKISATNLDALTDIAKQKHLAEAIKKPHAARVSAQNIFAKPKAAAEAQPTPSVPKKNKPMK